MTTKSAIALGLAALSVIGLSVPEKAMGQEPSADKPASSTDTQWRGVHMMSPGRRGLPLLKRAITEKLAPMGVNVLILEVNYGFAFQSHPELGGGENALRVEDARDLAETCRKLRIRLVPMLNCLGHQSWAQTTAPLLAKHPELDESPGVPKNNKGIYCRSWCPLHPDVNKIVFALIDELIDAFGSDAFHVGMDEVFLVRTRAAPGARARTPRNCSRNRSMTCTTTLSMSGSRRC